MSTVFDSVALDRYARSVIDVAANANCDPLLLQSGIISEIESAANVSDVPSIDSCGSVQENLICLTLFVRNAGILPYYHYRVIAGILTDQVIPTEVYSDFNALKQLIASKTHITQTDIIYGIACQCASIRSNTSIDPDRIDMIKKAYNLGFYSEKKYRGCAQGTLNALAELTGVRNKELFRAATGFSGGMALCGDGVCGGYSGGLMYLSDLKGRDFDRIPIDGDKENQYFAYECAQLLHDRYIDCFGSPVCGRIHEAMFGEQYVLRTKPRRNEFEEAGAHTIVCTTVVALACAWITEIMLDKGLLSI